MKIQIDVDGGRHLLKRETGIRWAHDFNQGESAKGGLYLLTFLKWLMS